MQGRRLQMVRMELLPGSRERLGLRCRSHVTELRQVHDVLRLRAEELEETNRFADIV